MARIVLDTDVVSQYRIGRLPAGFALLVVTNDISIAFATAGELWKGALAKRWGAVHRGGLDPWLAETKVLAAGMGTAKVWGEMMAAGQRRGRPRPLNDSWIAACCIESGLPLLTLNRRDFADFAEHDGLMLLGG